MSYRVSAQKRTAVAPAADSDEDRTFGRRGMDDARKPLSARNTSLAGSSSADASPARWDYAVGRAARPLRLGPVTFWSTVMVLVAMAVWSAGTATYFVFRDDVLTGLIARQADMQYAYEDRIADLRGQMERLASRKLLDQQQIDQRVELLAKRQSALESRASALSGLHETAPVEAMRQETGTHLEGMPPAPPKPSPISDTVIIAPAPDRRAVLESRTPAPRLASRTGHDAGAVTLSGIEESLDRVEARQSGALLAIEDLYGSKARRIRSVLADLGLDTRKVVAPPARGGIGGPFIPVDSRRDTSAFERQLHRVRLARAQVDRLTKVLVAVPLRKPLRGASDTSSGFGVRLDPFLRSPAMHSGLDFRAPPGEPVRVTAAGTVTASGWNGGYGRMIEVDHGNGFSTRYAHLSEILVKEDQTVRPGQVVGRVGSTGRSTGPHLHYETRINGEAVDPHKFLRAGLRLGDKL